eukprot:6212736-Prymnesium_polylepis.1
MATLLRDGQTGSQCYGNIFRTAVPTSMNTIEVNSAENSSFEYDPTAEGNWTATDRHDDWAELPAFATADRI